MNGHIRTDGQGRVVQAHGVTADAAAQLAESVDLVAHAGGAVGKRHELGGPRTIIYAFEGSTVVVRTERNGNVALADTTGKPMGLLLAQLTQLMSQRDG